MVKEDFVEYFEKWWNAGIMYGIQNNILKEDQETYGELAFTVLTIQ